MFRSALTPVSRRLFSSTPVSRNTDAFADLARITSTSAPAPSTPVSSSSSTSFLPPTAAGAGAESAPARGYAVHAMPYKTEPVLELFTNCIMSDGKKGEAQRHVANILTMLQRATNEPPVPLLRKAIELSSPQVRIMSTKRGAKIIQTPRALNERQRTRAGIQWLLKAAERGRKGAIKRDDRIAREVLAVLEGTSDVFKKVEELHRAAMLVRSNINKF